MNTCGYYGRNWMCPPAVGDLHACRKRIEGYDNMLLFKTEFPIGDMFDLGAILSSMSTHQEIVAGIRDMALSEIPLPSPCRQVHSWHVPNVRTLQVARPRHPFTGSVRNRPVHILQEPRCQIRLRRWYGDILRHRTIMMVLPVRSDVYIRYQWNIPFRSLGGIHQGTLVI